MIGLLVHIFKFTNVLPNADALYNFYSSQNMVASGRWLLAAACSLGSWFDFPWVNGMLSLFFMGLTAAVIMDVFTMKNPCLIILSSGLLVSFPAITATMSYEFTADGYMLSMLLAAVSVALTRMRYLERCNWKNMVLSGLCICLSCGIYQAYVSFAFVLAVCYFMTELLDHGVTVYSGLNILFLAAFVQGLAAAARKSGCFSGKLQILLLGLCVAALPFGCYIWYLTSPEVGHHSLMLQSVWPAADSVQVMGDTLVVKLSEYEIPVMEPDQE